MVIVVVAVTAVIVEVIIEIVVVVIVVVTTVVVSWYFEPSQPQLITSGPKQTSVCLLFTLHTSHETKFSKTNKQTSKQTHIISPDTNLHQTKYTQTSFRRSSPFGIAPVKKSTSG